MTADQRPLTRAQVNVLRALRHGWARTPARRVPSWAVSCYDGRVVRGLLARGLLSLAPRDEHDPAPYLLTEYQP